MHLIISNAKPPHPQCHSAIRTLGLPHLRAFLQGAGATKRIKVDAQTLTPPGELLHAQCLGLPAQDGLVPWAAWQALQLGLPQATGSGWARLSLCHWQINADHVAMQDPAGLRVTPVESQTLMDAMCDFFAEDGITLHAGPDGTWLAQGELFAQLPTASLERACGSQVDSWMPRHEQAKPLRRLQNVMQMLLYTHPVNDARAAKRVAPINSFWLSGTGRLPPGFAANAEPVQYLQALCKYPQSDNAAEWVAEWLAEWQRIDATVLAARPATITLCSTTDAQTFERGAQSLWGQLKGRFFAPDISALLQSL